MNYRKDIANKEGAGHGTAQITVQWIGSVAGTVSVVQSEE
jgi:hypothetical protein